MSIVNELTYPWLTPGSGAAGSVMVGCRGAAAKRVQEWLTLRGQGLAIDGSFGNISAHCVENFQTEQGLPVTGVVDEDTWDALTQPMRAALAPIDILEGDTLPTVFARVTAQHLAAKPREIGGDNRGPWVRLYMRGLEGDAQQWCAGSATTMLLQAAGALGVESPVAYNVSCNRMADQARKAGRLVQGERASDVPPAGLFLVEKEDRSDPAEKYSHTGVFIRLKNGVASTIEGNFGSGRRAGMYPYHRDLSKNDIIRID